MRMTGLDFGNASVSRIFVAWVRVCSLRKQQPLNRDNKAAGLCEPRSIVNWLLIMSSCGSLAVCVLYTRRLSAGWLLASAVTAILVTYRQGVVMLGIDMSCFQWPLQRMTSDAAHSDCACVCIALCPCRERLHIKPEENAVLFTEPTHNTREVREKTVQMAFEHLR